jgi:uncharacterized protein DUF3108
MCKLSSLITRVCVLTLGSALLLASPPAPFAAAGPAEIAPVEVDATYDVTINGFGIGTFNFNSNVANGQYTLDTNVELSALLGVFRWKGNIRSSGTIAQSKPTPAGFRFDFESSSRHGSIQMGFNEAGVQNVAVLPGLVTAPDTVPLKEQHVKGVLDPLTAILALTHVPGVSPCAQRLPVFDGVQRFDLVLSYRRHVPIAEGQQDMAIVCRVKYVPIAGYRNNDETRDLANNVGIEITFRPVPSAKLMLPQAIVVPTVAGNVELTLTKVAIKTRDRGKIALVD